MKAVVVISMLLALALAAPKKPSHIAVVDDVIPDEYIITLVPGVKVQSHLKSIFSLLAFDTSFVRHQYSIGEFQGYSGVFHKSVIESIKSNKDVLMVESNRIASINADQRNPPSWGLDRVDQAALPLNQLYQYADHQGSGVDSYTIDTGINNHNDYNGRYTWGANFVGDNINSDCNGHGTHVAGTTGGTSYGIAKLANLIAVKVLGCSGSGAWDGVISGIGWVTDQHTNSRLKLSVANMSLGGGKIEAVNRALDESSYAGVIHVVAAGNNGGDACNFSPASAPTAISVGATDSTDGLAAFSNRGACVHILAPGVSIVSTWHTSMTATNTLSGTSLAAPHVAGVVALRLAEMGETDYLTMRNYIQSRSTKNAIRNVPAGTLNYLLYSL